MGGCADDLKLALETALARIKVLEGQSGDGVPSGPSALNKQVGNIGVSWLIFALQYLLCNICY